MPYLDILDKLADNININVNSHGLAEHDRHWSETKSHGDYDLWHIISGRIFISNAGAGTEVGTSARAGAAAGAGTEAAAGASAGTAAVAGTEAATGTRTEAAGTGSVIEAGEGDAVLFNPGFAFTASTTDSPCKFIYMHFSFSIGKNNTFLNSLGIAGVFKHRTLGDEGKIFTDTYGRYAAKKPSSGLDMVRLQACLTIYLMKLVETGCSGDFEKFVTQRTAALTGRPGSALSPAALNPVLEYISENLDIHLNIGKLASIMHFNEKYFIRCFKGLIGVTPWQYITSLRMMKAKDYMLGGRYSIKETASMLGYPDRHSFSKAFKRYCGVSPSRYHQIS